MATMTNQPVSWREIENAARQCGAGHWAIRKWHQRGQVPPKWQIQIAKELKVSPDEIAPEAAQ